MKKVLGFLAGFLVCAGLIAGSLALGQVSNLTQYVGYNPTTNVYGSQGLSLSLGQLPTLGASTSCGTTSTVQASMVGGTSIFQLTAGATTCTIQVVYPVAAAAPNGVFCVFVDETTVADANNLHQASHTTTGCTSNGGTVVSGDKILVEVNAF